MDRYFSHQGFCGDLSSRFSGRVGSIIHTFRPALVLTDDAVADDEPVPPGFDSGFDTLKAHIRRAAAATGRIQTAAPPKRVLAPPARIRAAISATGRVLVGTFGVWPHVKLETEDHTSDRTLPRRTRRTSAMMARAISAGVLLPISRPMGT